MNASPAEQLRLPLRVLVADDADGVRELVMLLLDMENDFTVVGQARDGVEAVDRARDLQPDLVVLDISMPRLDGITAIPRILNASPTSRVALFTGMAEVSVEAEARRAGADAVLPKELGATTLVDRLREVCRGPRGRMPSSA
ncbi:MAG TPA: response regulator transcription factor [Frankiaceae bacterium]|nr:response regulator transcription factor [Frankiaceae bacterium]